MLKDSGLEELQHRLEVLESIWDESLAAGTPVGAGKL